MWLTIAIAAPLSTTAWIAADVGRRVKSPTLVALMVMVGAWACGRVGFDSSMSTADSSTSTADSASTVVDGEPQLGSFGTPEPVGELASASLDEEPSLTGDMLEIYFASRRAGGAGQSDIWRSTRPTLTALWSAPQPVTELNTTTHDFSPDVSSDGLEIYITRGGDVWRSRRNDRSAPWADPMPVVELNSTGRDFGAAPNEGGLMLLISSSRPGNLGDRDLFIFTRADLDSPWSLSRHLTELSTALIDGTGMLASSGLFVTWGRERDDPMNERDLFYATRSSIDEPFGAPQLFAELNSDTNDADPWISPDLSAIYFTSNRTGDTTIFRATRR